MSDQPSRPEAPLPANWQPHPDGIVADSPAGLSFLLTTPYANGRPRMATKTYTWNPALKGWLKSSYNAGMLFTVNEVTHIAGIGELAEIIRYVASFPAAFIIRGALKPEERERNRVSPGQKFRRLKHPRPNAAPPFREVPRQFFE